MTAGTRLENVRLRIRPSSPRYYWNLTDWKTDDDDAPHWKGSDDDVMYSDFWSSVFAVGTYDGHRYFGWYLCGPPVTVTQRGQYFILYEKHEYDDGFISAAKEKVVDAGLTRGNFTEYFQSSSCLYNWHHIAKENGNEWEDDNPVTGDDH